MNGYTDIFNKPVTKNEAASAARLVVAANKPQPMYICTSLRIGYHKASVIMTLLEDAGVVAVDLKGHRTLALKNSDEAVNAALRQLKKAEK